MLGPDSSDENPTNGSRLVRVAAWSALAAWAASRCVVVLVLAWPGASVNAAALCATFPAFQPLITPGGASFGCSRPVAATTIGFEAVHYVTASPRRSTSNTSQTTCSAPSCRKAVTFSVERVMQHTV